LVVDANRVFAGQIPFQGLKPIAGRQRHVAQHAGIVQLHQLAARGFCDSKGKAFGHLPLAQDRFGELSLEASYHMALLCITV
jgi:hypothetical protein